MSPAASEPIFFDSPDAFRAWLADNHTSARELWVGYYRKGTKRPTLSWHESVGEALCFGWIDGVRRRVDEESYVIRFTPRRPGSHWSQVNLRRVEELIQAGRMEPAGLRAYRERDPRNSGKYSFEPRDAARLDPELEARIRGDPAAWRFWEAQPAGYRRTMIRWVVSAQREETRTKRLARLIEESAAGRRIDRMRPAGG